MYNCRYEVEICRVKNKRRSARIKSLNNKKMYLLLSFGEEEGR